MAATSGSEENPEDELPAPVSELCELCGWRPFTAQMNKKGRNAAQAEPKPTCKLGSGGTDWSG
ncbi:Hypothetical predicted protein, partial [Pelobates cultripes]